MLIRGHGSAEDRAQDSGGLVVKACLGSAAVAQSLEVRACQVIILI